MLNLCETTRPSPDIYNKPSKHCREDKEAVIITVHGKKDIELLEAITEAEEDVKNGRIAPISETFDNLRMILKSE